VLPVAAQRIELPYMKVCGDEISQSYARYESSETRKLVRIDCHQNYRYRVPEANCHKAVENG
jgi:hypothetical protein